MKRLLVFLTVFFTVFTLASCDLLTDDLKEQISEELCKNDPNNELCDLEALNNLEDSVVLSLVEELHMKYNEDGFTEVCPDFISPSNPDLLEKCRNGEFMILPEVITEFTPKMVEKDGDIYIITGEHNMTDKELMIKVKIVDVETKFYIEEYSYELKDKEVDIPTEITEDMAFEFYKNFFMNFGDKTISNEEFCMMYYKPPIDEDCDGMREDFFEDYTSVAKIEPLKLEQSSKVHGHVTVLKAMDGGGEEFEVTLELMLDDNGAVYVYKLYTPENSPLHEEAKTMAENMLYDYVNPDISTDEFLVKYMFANHNTTRSNRTRAFDSGAVDTEMLSMSLVKDNTFEIVYVVMDDKGMMTFEVVHLMIEENDTGFKSEFMNIEVDHVISSSDAKASVDSFFDIFVDVALEDKDFYMKYPGAWMAPEALKREEYKGRTVSDITVKATEEGGALFLVSASLTKDNMEPMMIMFMVEFITWNDMEFMAFYDNRDNDCDGVCEVQVERFNVKQEYGQYLASYMNPDVSDDELVAMYFDTTLPESFFDIRKEVQDKKTKLMVTDIVGPVDMDTYILIVMVEEADGTMRMRDDKIKLTKRVDKATPLLSIVDPDSDGDSIPIDEKRALLDQYIIDYNRQSILAEHTCPVLQPHRIDRCIEERKDDMGGEYMIIGIDLVVTDRGNDIHVRKRPGRTTYSNITLERAAYFYYNENNELVMEMVDMDLPDYMMQLEDQLTLLFDGINDPTKEIVMVCDIVHPDSVNECSGLRTDMQDQQMYTFMIQETDFEYILEVYMQTSDSEATLFRTYEVSFLYCPLAGMSKLHIKPLIS